MLKLSPGAALDEQLLMDQFDANQLTHMNKALTACGAIVATTTTKAKTAATCVFLSGGQFKSKAATDNFWVFTTAHTIPTNATLVQEQVYGLCIDATGAASITMGGITSGAGTAPLPERPAAGIAQVAQVRISVAAGGVFTGGTTAVATGGDITAVYADVGHTAPLFNAAQ